MRLPYYEVHAFTGPGLRGNPAGVCLMERWIDDATMLAIAQDNALSETAFVIPRRNEGKPGETHHEIRWFSSVTEIDLCGHATLASAHVVLREQGAVAERVVFHSRSGALFVERRDDRLALDFPARPARRVPEPSPAVAAALGHPPTELWQARDLVAVYERERDVRGLAPDMGAIVGLGVHGVIATAPGDKVDFVSRFFAPSMGVPEDPVTGSTHCTLVPLWAERLGTTRLHARQVSARGGDLVCELRGDRVVMAGHARTYLTGTIEP